MVTTGWLLLGLMCSSQTSSRQYDGWSQAGSLSTGIPRSPTVFVSVSMWNRSLHIMQRRVLELYCICIIIVFALQHRALNTIYDLVWFSCP